MKQLGVSLVEILLVIASVGFLVLLLANLPSSVSLIGKSRNQGLAREIASKALEDKRAISYINLANGSSAITDPRVFSLPSGQGSSLVEDCDPQICTQGENAKQITVTVTWKEAQNDQTVKLKTLISEGGLNQ